MWTKLMAAAAAMIVAGTVAIAADQEKKSDEVELKGQIGCTRCTFDKGKCGVSFKTEDGKIYSIENPSQELSRARAKGGIVKVSGTVKEVDGRLLVQASKAELVKDK
jgi:hypothetical protein